MTTKADLEAAYNATLARHAPVASAAARQVLLLNPGWGHLRNKAANLGGELGIALDDEKCNANSCRHDRRVAFRPHHGTFLAHSILVQHVPGNPLPNICRPSLSREVRGKSLENRLFMDRAPFPSHCGLEPGRPRSWARTALKRDALRCR